MREIDLIPADYARTQALRRRLRRLITALVALAAFTLLARGTLSILLAAEKDDISRLQATKRLWQEAKTQTEKHAGEALAAEKQLSALAELHGRDHLRLFLEAVDRAYVERVWFDEIRYYRREVVAAPERNGAPARVEAGKAAPGVQRVEQRVGMVGHAMNHVTLAEFMKKLELQPAVAELALVDTSPRAYPQALIIDFKLGLLLEPKAKGPQQ